MMTEAILQTEERAMFALRSLYRRYGYMPYKMSRFEEYDLYVRNKDFLVSDQIITFSDRAGRLLALKPDVTLSIVKNAPEEPGSVQKVYYHENVYRDFREISQTGLECVGDLGGYEILEVLRLAAESLKLLGETYVLDISHMGLVSAVLDSCGLTTDQEQKALECLRRKNTHELKALCGANERAWQKLQVLSSCRGSGNAVLAQVEQILTTEAEREAFRELKELWLGIGYLEPSLRLDFSVGNDMRYYSGVVFRGYLKGISTSILSGGQYDRLAQRMGKKCRAIGFAIYLNLLQELSMEAEAFDIDLVILHDGSSHPVALTAMASTAMSRGESVLVTRKIPEGIHYRKVFSWTDREGKG